MARLQKSIDKRTALLKSTLGLINEGGVQEACMSKVAKMANVSPATIYLYFENKQDLVNQLYNETRELFSKNAFKDFDESMPVKKSFKAIWYNIAEFRLKYNEEASFLAQCESTPIVEEDRCKKDLHHLKPLVDLWLRGQQEGIIKEIEPYLLYAYTIYPMSFVLNKEDRKVEPDFLEAAFNAAWDAIKL
ncbi:TetR/AcrR family transcriptional regulator [Arcticibacterium luteifluviistationis]|uniref:TetR family transcriptional regulator n=1 Tax=Arcticibacterium luteifluviistationis TaxID=1784714 RepID=A0A2Z4GGK3_9BACT|nr:TetR/AcrR family transcriptional regulator [Arcticibacterium luteifluviistationis]AWW00367.1 TetR family transcriptional regulator [Arcticibacterium luteifluviistationis]